jgi:hypothetical protein
VIKERKIKWAGTGSAYGKMRNEFEIWAQNLKVRDNLGALAKMNDKIKCAVNKQDVRVRSGFKRFTTVIMNLKVP